MKKYSKKIALILVLSLALALAIPAFAVQTEITGTYEAPNIQVVVPTNISAVVNPLGLPVEIKADDGSSVVGEVVKNQIVTTEPILGYTYGTVDLSVGASVTGTIPTGSGFTFASEKPDSDSTSKTGLVYLEVKPGAADFDLGYTNSPDTATCIGAFNGAKVVTALNGWAKTTYRESEKSQVLVKAATTKKTGMTTIKAIDSTTKLPTNASCFVARLGSDIVKAPKVDWATTDGIKVTVAWIFEPVT